MARRKITDIEVTEPLDGLNPGILQEMLSYHSYQMQSGLSRYAFQDLEGIPLDRVSFGPLLLIYANPGVVQGRLARALGVERSTMVPSIDKLELKGFVERRPHPTDGRSNALWLTAKGQRVATKIERLFKEQELKIFDGFSTKERQTLMELMQRVTMNVWKLSSDKDSH